MYLSKASGSQPFERAAKSTRNDAHATLVAALVYTGLRWGEAIGLRVGDLNMLRRACT